LQTFVALPAWAVAIAFMTLIAVVNFRGVGESVRANVVLTCVEVAGLLIVVGVGAYGISRGASEPARLTEFDTTGQSALIAVTSAAALAFLAMVGFEDSVNMAEECVDPVRHFPKALLGGLAVAGVLYLLIAIVSSLLVPTDVLAAAGSGALMEVIKVGAPAFPLTLFAIIGLFAVSNSALINMLMASRLLYGMSNERIVPQVFGTVHPRRRTPWVSILFTTAIAVLLVSSLDVDRLGGTTSLLLLVVFTIVNVACLVLRRDRVSHNHFRAPTAIPALAAACCAYLASPLSGRPSDEYVVAGLLLVLGLLPWTVNRLVLGRTPQTPTRATRR